MLGQVCLPASWLSLRRGPREPRDLATQLESSNQWRLSLALGKLEVTGVPLASRHG